jgi:hypothetical protein
VTVAGNYDASEARVLLERAIGAQPRYKTARYNATVECLTALQKLVEDISAKNREILYTDRDREDVLEVGITNQVRVFLVVCDGGVEVRTEAAKHFVELSYDVATRALEGTDDETFVTPVPGEQKKRRSALAILAEAIANAITPTRTEAP